MNVYGCGSISVDVRYGDIYLLYIHLELRIINKPVDIRLYFGNTYDTANKEHKYVYKIIDILARMISDEYINNYIYLKSLGYKDYFNINGSDILTENNRENDELTRSLLVGMIKPIQPDSFMYMRISLFDKCMQLCAFDNDIYWRNGKMRIIFSTKLDEITEDTIINGGNDIIAQFAASVTSKKL
jgi:hypothetical protein